MGSQFVGQELGKNLNADEAAALGSVYRTADISTGFKVKKFITKDAVVFPIDVDFSREVEASDDGDEKTEAGVKKVRRTLFSRMNPFPQKKIMTFNKHVKDFVFNVNYADLDYLGETEVAWLGSQNITSVEVKGVKDALDSNTGDNVETKGVKAHFSMDESGIISVSGVESVFEKTVSVEEQEKREKEWKDATDGIDWSKLGDNIKSFFGTDEKKEGEDSDQKTDETKDSKKEENKEDEKKEKKDEKKDDKKDSKKDKEPKKPKVEAIKVDLSTDGVRNDVNSLEGSVFEASKTKLEALAKADADRMAIEAALNELQGYSVDLVDKLEDEEFVSASTDEEREKLSGECSAVSDWLDEEAGVFTPVEEFQTKLKSLKEMAAPVMARLREHRERPEALEMLRQSLNSTRFFLEKSRDLIIPAKPKEEPEKEAKAEEGEEGSKAEETKEEEAETADKKEEKKEKKSDKVPDEGIFTAKEMEGLEKKLAEVEKWRDEKVAEQEAMVLSEMPKLTVSSIKSKIQDLDGEVQLLIGKARMIRAERERAKRKAEEEKKKEEEKAKKEKKKKKKEKKKKQQQNLQLKMMETNPMIHQKRNQNLQLQQKTLTEQKMSRLQVKKQSKSILSCDIDNC